MRTIGYRSNVLVAVAAACGVILALARPWYGRKPALDDELVAPTQMEDLSAAIGRAFAESAGVTGWAALERADQLIAGLAVATAVLVLLSLVPPLQLHVQALARWTAIAAFGVLAVKLVDTPDRFGEPRYGLLLALGAGIVLLTSTMNVANTPLRRRTPPKRYTPPPPAPAPAPAPESSWGPPTY